MKLFALAILTLAAAPAFANEGAKCNNPLFVEGSRTIVGTPQLQLNNGRTAYFPASTNPDAVCSYCGWGARAEKSQPQANHSPVYMVEMGEDGTVKDITWSQTGQYVIGGLTCAK